jgi:hypothetical protein
MNDADRLAPLRGLKGKEYRNAWNKLHRDRCNAALKRYRTKHLQLCKDRSKAAHRKHIAENGCSYSTKVNDLVRPKATKAYEPWSIKEDECLFSGVPDLLLAERLKRSIRAIQHRRNRIRNGEV